MVPNYVSSEIPNVFIEDHEIETRKILYIVCKCDPHDVLFIEKANIIDAPLMSNKGKNTYIIDYKADFPTGNYRGRVRTITKLYRHFRNDHILSMELSVTLFDDQSRQIDMTDRRMNKFLSRLRVYLNIRNDN